MTDERPENADPDSEEDSTSLADGTLGGYLVHHNRPPAFEGMDGSAYTVSLEVEKTGNLAAPFSGYLVFPRWADTGAGIVGHLETPTLASGRSEDEVKEALGALTLHDVNRILAEAIVRRNQETD
jgi:hypothetical protein